MSVTSCDLNENTYLYRPRIRNSLPIIAISIKPWVARPVPAQSKAGWKES